MVSKLFLLRNKIASAAEEVICQYLLLTQQCTPGLEALKASNCIFLSPVGNYLTIGERDPESQSSLYFLQSHQQ